MRRVPRMLAGLAILAGPLALASPPTDEQITTAITAFRDKIKNVSSADRAAALAASRDAAALVLEGLPINELSLGQIQQLRDAGANDFLKKPFDVETLIDRICQLLDVETAPRG